MKIDNCQKELDRYLSKNKDNFNEKVLEYGISFIERIKTNNLLKEYFDYNSIGIYSFLSELLPISQHKLKTIGGETLDENEINQVFGSVILNNEILKLLLDDEIIINGINPYDEIVYELSNNAISYFNTKYGIKLNKKFSIRDIVIVNVEDSEDKSSFLK